MTGFELGINCVGSDQAMLYPLRHISETKSSLGQEPYELA